MRPSRACETTNQAVRPPNSAKGGRADTVLSQDGVAVHGSPGRAALPATARQPVRISASGLSSREPPTVAVALADRTTANSYTGCCLRVPDGA